MSRDVATHRSAAYLLDTTGHVIGWPPHPGMRENRRPREWHVARFYTPEDRATHAPERDLRIASDAGLEMRTWRIHEDGSPFWAHVVLKPLEGENGQLGFVLVQTQLGDGSSRESSRQEGSTSALTSDATADSLRDQVRALASIVDDPWVDMPEGVRARLSLITRQLEVSSASLSTRSALARQPATFPSKFDRRRK